MKRILILFLSIVSLSSFAQDNEATQLSLSNYVATHTLSPANVANALNSIIKGKPNYLAPLNTSGTNNYSAIGSSSITSYGAGLTQTIHFVNGNTGAVTININSIGVKNILTNAGVALSSGDIPPDSYFDIVYNGTDFKLKGAAASGGGAGTVTNFTAGNLSPLFTTSVGSPTTTPALTFSLTSQSANTHFSGPPSGGSGAPTFRSLVAADIPTLAYWPLSGTATFTGDVSIDGARNILIGQSTPVNSWIITGVDIEFASATQSFALSATGAKLNLGGDATGDIYYRNSSAFLVPRHIGSTGDVLTTIGGVPTWAPPATGGTVTSVTSANGDATVSNSTTTPLITIVSAPKWSAGRTISITGDLSYTSPSIDGSGNVTAAGTLATVNSNVGSFGGATVSPSITVNAKGLITAVSTNTITPAVGSITGLGSGIPLWLATPSWTNLTAALTGTAPYWNVTGSTSVTSPTITGNANEMIFNGTWTASANQQRHIYINPNITMRSNTNDNASAVYIGGTVTPQGTTQDANGVTINPVLNVKGGVATITTLSSNTTAGCTNGTTTNFSGYTYTNMDGTGATGSGALFTVVVSGNVVTSITMTTAGSGYRYGDRFVFSGSSFGGSGSVTTFVYTLDRALNSSAASLRVVHNNYYPTNNVTSIVNKWIDFQQNIAGTLTSLMYLGYYNSGSSSTTVTLGDSFGEIFNVNAGVMNMTRALTLNAAFVSGVSTSTKEITYNGTNISVGSNLSALQSGVTQRFSVANQRFSSVYASNTVGSGVPATGSITNAGSGYTNGTFAGTSMTGGSGTGLLASITVSGNVVTSVTLSSNSAINYRAGDVVSASLAGGSGFQYTLSTVDFNGTVNSIVRSSQTYTDNGGAATMKNITVYDDRTVTQNGTAGTPYLATLEQNITVSSGTPNLYGILIRNTTSYSSFGLGSTNPGALIDVGGSTTTRAPLRLRSGTAPTSPNDGDIWFDGSALFIRIGGVTKTFTVF